MWMWKVDSSSVLLLQQLLIFHDDTSRWFNKHAFRPKVQICILGIKDKVDSFFCSHFEWLEIRHADVSWPPWELIRFLPSSVDFPRFGGILT